VVAWPPSAPVSTRRPEEPSLKDRIVRFLTILYLEFLIAVISFFAFAYILYWCPE
jgi:cell division septal protein FtsQ